MNKSFSRNFILIIYIVSFKNGSDKTYFQQDIKYDIDVTLNDKEHSLLGFEKIEYTNNSPDTLDFIWFHLWPNAYKNDSTAFAKQQIRMNNLRFSNSEKKDRGFIDSLNFIVNGIKANIEEHPEWIAEFLQTTESLSSTRPIQQHRQKELRPASQQLHAGFLQYAQDSPGSCQTFLTL